MSDAPTYTRRTLSATWYAHSKDIAAGFIDSANAAARIAGHPVKIVLPTGEIFHTAYPDNPAHGGLKT